MPPKVAHYSPLVGWLVVFGRTQGRQRLVGRSGQRRTSKMMPPYRNFHLVALFGADAFGTRRELQLLSRVLEKASESGTAMSLRVEEPTRRRLFCVGLAPRAEPWCYMLGS